MYTINPKTRQQLFALLTSVDFDLKRISIADDDLTDASITLLLEDKDNPKTQLDECVELIIGIHEFAAFIAKEKHNYYSRDSFTKDGTGHAFKEEVMINEPIPFYTGDATEVGRQWIREELVEEILSEVLSSVTHG